MFFFCIVCAILLSEIRLLAVYDLHGFTEKLFVKKNLQNNTITTIKKPCQYSSSARLKVNEK